ncbi:HET-domain-containing protein, partial [Acephala macrosclerotiorum]
RPDSLHIADISTLAKDIIAVVKGLGQRYLWIDALCIIQDDENNKSFQIQGMADIYSQSYLTIVALASENADSRLPGVSTRRENLITVIDGMPITTHFPGLKATSTGRVYEQRVWMFQERLLSKRCLYFSDNRIYLECQTGCVIDHDLVFPVQDRRGRSQKGFNPLQELKSLRKLEINNSVSSISLKELEIFINQVSE